MKKRALYFIIILLIPYTVWSQADTNLTYASQTGTSGTKYSWIDSGAGSSSALVSNIATLNPNRATLVAGNNGPVCQGGTLSLTATTVAGATYSWTGPNGYTSNLQNPTVSTKALPSMSGLYSVTTTVGGIPSVATTNVTVVGISQIPAGAILNYKFNGNANDEANTNNGTLQKSPTPTPDRFNLINSAYSFNGTTQYVSTANQYTNPTNFTISIWFKTNTTTGGKLIGFGSLKTGSSGSYDRHLYMSDAGQIYFGVYPNAVVTVNSPLSYNDDIWHHAIATFSSTTGMTLYMDGQQVAYNSNTLAESYTGYWKIGYDNNAGWVADPSSFYFNGTLDDALVYHTALNSTQVAALYNSPDGAGNYGYACVGSNLDLTATTISGATYSWTGPNGFNSSSQNPSFIYSSAYKGVYTVQVSSGACSSVAYTAVSSVEITGTTPGSRRGTGTVVLGATSSFGTVNWYSTATGGASLGTGTSFTTPSISTTTTYYVDATYNGCTSSPRTAVVATIVSGPAASWNYGTQTGNLNTTYSWINCSSGSNIVSGDDAQATINWPFNFSFYDNNYTTAVNLSLSTNGFIRLDGDAGTNYSAASAYTLSSNSIELGQIIAMGVYDNKVGDNSGWVRSLVTGTAPNRIFTIEYNNLEIDYNDAKYADVQVSFYEASNKIVLKLGTHNVTLPGADMGLHSGVETFFNKWQEVNSGTKDTWIEYTPPYIEVNATTGTPVAFYSTLKDAFDKVNNGTHKGNITIKINHSTTETAPAVLNASGTGGSNYSAINIYPTETGFSVSGDLASPLIDLNGADNVTIDGRVNATGTTSDLTINN